jgi:mannitol-1-phosphate/altronate dehydrogenase
VERTTIASGMAILNKQNLAAGFSSKISVQTPNPAVFDYPEKVLQFGTGVLLRGLCDFFIDKANRTGQFKGRVVVLNRQTDQELMRLPSKMDYLPTASKG